MAWWMKNNIRMIQNNIRDIDGTMDIDRHIQWLKSFHANTLQIGCGGITAFYPSKLDCQWKSPYMDGDFFGELVAKCHENHIRVISRFDFSKTHESFYEAHPDWYYRDRDGLPLRYHDTVSTCVNGAYQRERSLDILREVLMTYPVDGIFFNMFGYIDFDYSGNYVGICQCENCKKRFWEMYSAELPGEENPDDPVFIKYKEFKKRTVDEMLQSIRRLTKSINPDCAVSTYAATGVDIIRDESNCAVDRPLPFWLYQSSDNVAEVRGSYGDKISSNCCINAVDLPYRFMGVPDQLNRIRLYENMAGGGSLDWCIIGGFDEYPDHENFDGVREIFKFHELYEEYFSRLEVKAEVLLVKEDERRDLCPEYKGVFRMLKEEHILFTVVKAEVLGERLNEYDDYRFIILPGVKHLSDSAMEVLKHTKASVIATGLSVEEQGTWVEEIFGVRLLEKTHDVRGTYVKTEPGQMFEDLAGKGKRWVFLDGPFRSTHILEGARGVLPRVKKARFGPPERCFGHEETDDAMMVVNREKNVYIPWNIGTLYYKLGYHEFRKLMLDGMGSVNRLFSVLETNAPEMVEVFMAKCGPSTYMLQMINLTGCSGVTFFKPYPLENLRVRFKGIRPVRVEEMTSRGLIPAEYEDGLVCSMKTEQLYKAYLIRV